MFFRNLGEAGLQGKLIVIRIIVLNRAGLHGRITKNQLKTPVVTTDYLSGMRESIPVQDLQKKRR